jgi:3-hydroxyacyl-CoA dehydrogenase
MPQSEHPQPGHALVVGGGTMGVGIIAMFLAGGWKVDVVSRSASTRDGLPAACARALKAMGKPASTTAEMEHLAKSDCAEDIDATVRLSFGFRYAAAGPIVQKEHSGWDTTCAVAKIIWPDLTNAAGPPPILQRNVDEGRIGFKTKRGFFDWDDQKIAKERARYERALSKCLEIFREEGII